MHIYIPVRGSVIEIHLMQADCCHAFYFLTLTHFTFDDVSVC